MALPIPISYATMDARLVADIPTGNQWQYEPKWDGFRSLVFRDEKKIDLTSRKGQPLGRYFPEVVAAVAEMKANKFVLDCELAIPEGSSLSFDALLQRIHPAASRIKKLSVETPAIMIVFDLLVDERGKDMSKSPLTDRREALEKFGKKYFPKDGSIVLSPATTSLKKANKWFAGVGGALDGVIAKRLDLPYESGNRDGMLKVKKQRTADCVVGGFRYSSNAKTVGSLLLGLYQDGLLNHVGFCSSFTTEARAKLGDIVEPLIKPPGFTGKAPGGPSRWSTERSTEWQPLANKLVVEVQYDHFTGDRFRHGTGFLRWRPDKAPKHCTIDQVQSESATPMKFLKKHG